MISIIRYPGSKAKLVKQISALLTPEVFMHFGTSRFTEYREPFFGSGAAGLWILSQLPESISAWLNDIDQDLVNLWLTIRDNPKPLERLVSTYKPTVDDFYRFKEEDGATGSQLETGFRKLALHRMSVSGFGFMSGGPIGGRHQTSEYTVDCRWQATTICKNIRRTHRLLNRRQTRITCGDFGDLTATSDVNTVLYCDPTYVKQGAALYRYAMSDDDHRRLSTHLKETASEWVLSYDDHPLIRELYDWAAITPLYVTYTNACAKNVRPKNCELAITKNFQ